MLKELKDEDKEGGWCSEARVDAWKGLVWLNQEGGRGIGGLVDSGFQE